MTQEIGLYPVLTSSTSYIDSLFVSSLTYFMMKTPVRIHLFFPGPSHKLLKYIVLMIRFFLALDFLYVFRLGGMLSQSQPLSNNNQEDTFFAMH